MAKKKAKKQTKAKLVQPKKEEHSGDKTLQIIGLIVNILILPGLGSIIGGRIKTGIWQIVLIVVAILLCLVGIPLSLILIGIPLIVLGCLLGFAVWIWGIVTGIQMIQG